LAFSRRSREDPGLSASYALAVVLACNVMLARVLVVVAAIHSGFVNRLWLPIVVMAVPGLLFAGWMFFRHGRTSEAGVAPAVANPLSLSMAIKFALVYGVVKFLVTAASELQFARGVLAISAVAGLTDIDAIAVSMTNGVREGTQAPPLAALAVVIGCISNTMAKAGIAVALRSPELRRRILGVLGATAAAGAAGWMLVR
jgi:uncharacterized membrane protein (DUF4010 family)